MLNDSVFTACDSLSYGIGFIGNFNSNYPTDVILKAFFKFLDDAVALGKLSRNYQIHAHGDLSTSDGPGILFREIMMSWEKYSKTFDCSKL